MTWKPIRTAPHDGQEVLLFRPAKCGRNAARAVGRWLGYKERRPKFGWVIGRSDETTAVFDEPTHWMLPPDPPTFND